MKKVVYSIRKVRNFDEKLSGLGFINDEGTLFCKCVSKNGKRYLKTNRIEYYDRLSEVRTKGNYEQWIKFFLHGIMTDHRGEDVENLAISTPRAGPQFNASHNHQLNRGL